MKTMEEKNFFQETNVQEMQKLNGAVPKGFRLKKESKELIETNMVQRQLEISGSPQNSFKPRVPANKYVNLIDQSDVKWFAEISGRKLKDTSKIGISTNTIDSGFETNKSKRFWSHLPILCPIFNCETYFLPNDMIMHFLSFHYNQRAPIQRIYEKLRLIITIEPYKLISKDITCLGLVCYGGKNCKSEPSLAERNFCIEQNLGLHKDFEPLKGDYPIFILASIIHMEASSEEKNCNSELKLKSKDLSKLLVIWLAGVDINLPLYSTITTYDECRVYSRSVIVGLHSLSECQNPFRVYNSDVGCFRLHLNELSTFVNADKILKMEFVFHEDFSISLEN